jgi:hypothetical protein
MPIAERGCSASECVMGGRRLPGLRSRLMSGTGHTCIWLDVTSTVLPRLDMAIWWRGRVAVQRRSPEARTEFDQGKEKGLVPGRTCGR